MSTKVKSVWSLYKPMLITLVICLIVGAILHYARMRQLIEPTEIQHWLDANPWWGIPTLFFLSAGLIIVGFPRQLVAFSAGSLFGVTLGTLSSTLAATLACVIAFYVSRLFLQAWVHSSFPVFIARIQPLLTGKPFSATLAVRLLPVGSNAITNIVAGASPIPASAFVLASTLGYVPQMLTFALLGQGMEQVSSWQIVISLSLFVCAALIGVHLYRWYIKQPSIYPSGE
jgi:uncharacterized membrane protein YdjX (TVP38/TMEM64 family)